MSDIKRYAITVRSNAVRQAIDVDEDQGGGLVMYSDIRNLESRIAELSSENALMRPVVEAAVEMAAYGDEGACVEAWDVLKSSVRAYEAALAARDGSEGLPSAYAGECEACGDTGSVPVADLDGEGSITEVACPLCAEKEES